LNFGMNGMLDGAQYPFHLYACPVRSQPGVVEIPRRFHSLSLPAVSHSAILLRDIVLDSSAQVMGHTNDFRMRPVAHHAVACAEVRGRRSEVGPDDNSGIAVPEW